MLACRDYESMEIALACHMAYRDDGVPFFILLNCHGGYDAERVRDVAKRYENLFPNTIRIIDNLPPAAPYLSISRALQTRELEPYPLIFKVDDDSFPIHPGWLPEVVSGWENAYKLYGNQLAYVTPLINNNTWGFRETIRVLNLEDEYFGVIAREHRVGSGSKRHPRRVLSASEIDTGGYGTIWSSPHVARWLHTHTTLEPERFIQATVDLEPVLIPSQDRYSIGGILFSRSLWSEISDGSNDDENMLHKFCSSNDKKIVCVRNVPFVHLTYFSQREENRDILPKCLSVYSERCGHTFPVGLYQDRLNEIEARLRWMEKRGLKYRANWSGIRQLRAAVKRLFAR